MTEIMERPQGPSNIGRDSLETALCFDWLMHRKATKKTFGCLMFTQSDELHDGLQVTQVTFIPENKLLICREGRQNITLVKQAAQTIHVPI